jgi:serine/threonine protein kinase/HD-like signal output (HDOD) protein
MTADPAADAVTGGTRLFSGAANGSSMASQARAAMPPRLPPIEDATKLGPYRLLGELGEGGMGRVFRAEHTLIGRTVAIKILNAEVAGDPDVQSRFFMEARIVNEIHHPNIVEVTDFGTSAGRPFIVMEYLQGQTLTMRVEQDGALEEATAIRIARQIASALGAVHERGIVHRDLKPDNIFLSNHLDYPDFVKILDFGIAKFLRRDEAQRHHTQTGTVIGTPAYMSPEQCLGDVALDLRTDIYSLGVVLFQMVTGLPPFQAEGVGRLMLAQIQDAPPSAGVSRGLDAIIARALSKQPSARFASMREMRDALGALEDPRSPSIPNLPKLVPPTIALRPRLPVHPGRTIVDAPRAVIVPAPNPDERLPALLRARIAEIEPPALKPLHAAALALAQSPGFSFPAALDLVRQDARLGGLILRMANLEPYGGRAPALGIGQAIARVGAFGLCLAVVEQAARAVIDAQSPRATTLFRRPWQHALASGFIARRLAQSALPKDEPAYAYLSALLRDVGRPLVVDVIDSIERVARMDRATYRQPFSEGAVLDGVDACHQVVGERLAKAWGLPAPVIDSLSPDTKTPGGMRLKMVARLAGALADGETFYLRREDLERAEEALNAARAPLRLNDTSILQASKSVREWVAARG